MKRVFFITLLAAILYAILIPANCPALTIGGGGGTVTVTAEAAYNFDVDGAPARLAIGPSGKVYVADVLNHEIHVYSHNGVLLDSISGIQKPVSVGGDASGNIYVGDAATGSVMVFDPSLNFQGKLGTGDGEFLYPSDIAITSTGSVFVTDAKAATVKAFTSTNYSFGAFTSPSGIAIDEATSRLYIIDDSTDSRYVQIYGFNGTYISQVKLSGAFSSTVVRPLGIAVDGSRMYVTDGEQSLIAPLSYSGSLQGYLGTLGEGFGELRVPTDAALDASGNLFVANYENQRIEVFSIDTGSGYSDTLMVSPGALSFELRHRDATETQFATIDSTLPGASWSAVTTAPWLGISAASGITPYNIAVTANAAGLSSGVYKGQVVISDADGNDNIVEVTLVMNLRVTFEAAPSVLSMGYQSGASQFSDNAYPEQVLILSSTGEDVDWQAAVDVPWITLGAYRGTTPASVSVRVNSRVDELAVSGAATYTGKVTVSAGDIAGSPAEIQVILQIAESGNISVATNLSSAGFVLYGPQGLAGSGTSWLFEDVPSGEYGVFFTHVSGYERPPSQAFELQSGETVDINGLYRQKLSENGMVAVTGVGLTNLAALMNFSGDSLGFVDFFTDADEPPRYVDLVTGDFNGDGFSEISFSDGKGNIEIKTSGNVAFRTMTMNRARTLIASGDFDSDGRDDLYIAQRKGTSFVLQVYGLNSMDAWVRKNMIEQRGSGHSFDQFAVGDIDGDGSPEVLIGGNEITVYEIAPLEIDKEPMRLPYRGRLYSMALGDLDDDGIDEIIVSDDIRALAGHITVLKGDGTPYGIEFEAFPDMQFDGGAFVATADINGDSRDEILVGAGARDGNASLVRIFDSNGVYSGVSVDMLGLASYGVKVRAGRF